MKDLRAKVLKITSTAALKQKITEYTAKIKNINTAKFNWQMIAAATAGLFLVTFGAIMLAVNAENFFAPQEKTVSASEIITTTPGVKSMMLSRNTDFSPEEELAAAESSAAQVSEAVAKVALPVTIKADGVTRKIFTVQDTVREALSLAAVSLGSEDKLSGDVTLDSELQSDMAIEVIRVNTDYVYETIALDYEVETRNNSDMDVGTTKVVRDGKPGEAVNKYKVVRENGEITERTLVASEVVSSAVAKIVDVGTARVYYTSRGESYRYSDVIEVKVTAYTNSLKDTGKQPGDLYYGITYSGMKAQVGVIAVDPDVIPLGSKLYVEGLDFSDYGYCVAGDIGSGVQGYHIDLFFNTQAEADAFGVKWAKVYILK